jgi:hypothetical protein
VGGDGWTELAGNFELRPGVRQIIVVDVERVQTSCGFGVPLFDFRGQRDMLPEWAAKKGLDGIERYHREKNMASIDGIVTTLGKAIAEKEMG